MSFAIASTSQKSTLKAYLSTSAAPLWCEMIEGTPVLIASSGGEWASDIMNMVENAWGLFGSAFGPVVILSLFWKRFNYAGAVGGIIAGAIADIAWLLLFTNTVRNAIIVNTNIYEIVPGFIVCLLVSVFVSLTTKKPGAEVEAIYARATDPAIDD